MEKTLAVIVLLRCMKIVLFLMIIPFILMYATIGQIIKLLNLFMLIKKAVIFKLKPQTDLLVINLTLLYFREIQSFHLYTPQEIYPGSSITIKGSGFGTKHTGLYQFFVDGINFSSNIGHSTWTNNSLTMYIPTTTTVGEHELQIEIGRGIGFADTLSNKMTFTVLDSCTEDEWGCGKWGECLANGKQERTCEKTFDCPSINTPSPATTQSCTYTPPCIKDTWQCGSWGACSPQGIQTRSCNKTYDCPSAETASPATSQYCEAPNKPAPQIPSDDLGIINQDSIIKASVKLICPVSSTMASQGSGTVISLDGTILTNKHVVDGTVGCLVGFINNYNDEPYFNDRQIADIYSISSDSDIAILKLRNPYSRNLTAINIAGNNSNNLSLGDQITTYGYPAKFGTKITYTSGDFSGVDGNYLKTTAVIEYGNSGGGAYLKNGTFMGIPTAVMKGELNSLGYILSVNKINSWLNNSPIAYNYNSNNNYSRVSILEDIDLGTLNSLDLFIAENVIGSPISEGAIIRATNEIDIYIVKYVGTKKFKRLILSPSVFNNYGHLRWEDVLDVSQAVLDEFTTSELVRAAGDDKIYRLYAQGDKGQKRMIKNNSVLTRLGFDPDSIYEINKFDRESYFTDAVLE